MSENPKIDSLGSNLYTDSTDHTIEDYPGEINNEYLLGLDDSGGWYYNPINNNIMNYQLEGGEGDRPLELTLQFSMDENEVNDTFDDISELAEDLVDKTVLGHALILSYKLYSNTHMSKPQSRVYALRDVYDVGRTQSSRVLNKSPNTIDNQRSSAKRKAKQAKKFVKILQDYSPNQ